MHFDKPAKSPMPLYLLSRRKSVTEAQMEEFKAQAKCMEMSLFAVMDPTKPLCEIAEKSNETSVPAKDGAQEAWEEFAFEDVSDDEWVNYSVYAHQSL